MNVILDASPLGIGFYHRQAKTGISRVIDRLTTGLWQTNDVNLSLAASSHLAETMRYAQSVFGLNAPPFVNRPAEQRAARFENALLRPFGINQLPTKLIRGGFYETRKRLRAEHARFDTAQWSAGSIYHAPFFPIPASVAENRRLRTVQSVYDLIPVLHPEWFPDGDSVVRQMLQSLPPDAHAVTISDATKADLCQYTGMDPARVTTIYLAALPNLFYPVTDASVIQSVRADYQLGDAPYLLSLATFEPRKNIDQVVRCFAEIVRRGEIPTDVKLVLVGTKGWKFEQIMQELTTNETLRSRIVVTGFVPDDRLAALYSGAIAFVYPSLYEGFGLPPLEAMQCGLPVITSNVSSLPEVVGNAAITVAPTDTDALCQAMLTLVNNPALRADLSAKSVARAALFSWDKFTDEHVALYKQIAGQSAS